MTQKVSACIITKNEEKNISRCLNSLKWANEIIVVDSGSTDKTVEICKQYGCKVHLTEWLGYGSTKKLAVNFASNDWIFSIDADEEVSKELSTKIQKMMNSPKNDGYFVKRKSFYLKKMIHFSGWQNDYPLRLFNKKRGNFNNALVHESVEIPSNNLCFIEEVIFHYPYQSIDDHINKINLYSSIGAQSLFTNKKRINYLFPFLNCFYKFIKMYFLKLGILDGKEGLILAYYSAYGDYLKYSKLWKLQQKK